MTRSEYRDEMDKLITRFDKRYYPNDLLDLIYIEIQDLSLIWLKRTVAAFLGQHRPALIPEFREHSRIEKDRIKTNSRMAPKEITSIFSESERKELWDFVKKVARREVPQNELVTSPSHP